MSAAISGMGSAMMMAQGTTGASMRMPPTQKMNNLFSQIDTANTGSITQSQFTQAFNTLNPPAGFKAMGANAVFSALDTSNTGSVTRQQFVSGMTNLMSQLRQNHHASAGSTTPAQTVNASSTGLGQIGGNVNTQA
jgi:Ca2+-binding EF-hand superfamily protein